jgi:hypothetical protein
VPERRKKKEWFSLFIDNRLRKGVKVRGVALYLLTSNLREKTSIR